MSTLAHSEPKVNGEPAALFGDFVANAARIEPNSFRLFWRLGYKRLIPVVPPGVPLRDGSFLARNLKAGKDSRGKVPGIKTAQGEWTGLKQWQSWETAEADLATWHDMGAGVGIKTGDLGDGTSLVLIDADILDTRFADLVRAEIVEQIGTLPVRIGRAPKAGYLLRVVGAFPYTSLRFGDLSGQVEILSDGRYFVAHGTHPFTNRPYEWPNDIPMLSDVPVVEANALNEFMEHLRGVLPEARPLNRAGNSSPRDQASLKGRLDLVEKAVAAIPNTSEHFADRDSWLQLGYAIKGATQDDPDIGLTLFLEFSARWNDAPTGKDNNPDLVTADWMRMQPPYRIGADWLFDTAERTSSGAFSARQARAANWFEEPGDIDRAAVQSVVEGNVVPLFPESADTPVRRFTFEKFEDLACIALASGQKPLVQDLLDQGAMSVLYGESNVGKTFVAVDMAYAVATGREWAGLQTTQCPVVYVAAEGGRGFAKRLSALWHRHGVADDFYALRSPVDLRRPNADLEPLIASIQDLPRQPGLIVIDTLSRAFAGGDENSSVDMGAFVQQIDRLRQSTSAHLMVVHHSGKIRAKGARGHSLLRAATDTEIEVAEGQISVTKQRDLEKSVVRSFVLEPIMLGVNEQGAPVTSAALRIVDRKQTDGDWPALSAAESRRRVAVGEAVIDVVGGVGSQSLTAIWQQLSNAMEQRGVAGRNTRQGVTAVVRESLADRDVEVEVDGLRFSVRAEKSGEGQKAPWVLIAAKVPNEASTEKTDKLSGELEHDEHA